MGNFDSNYSIAQEISARIGNSPIPFDSVYSICLQIYKDLGGTESNFDSVYSILLEILPIVEGGINPITEVAELPFPAEDYKDKMYRYKGDVYTAGLKDTFQTNRLPDEQQIDKAFLWEDVDNIYYYKGAYKVICSDGVINCYGWLKYFSQNEWYFYGSQDDAVAINQNSLLMLISFEDVESIDFENKTIVLDVVVSDVNWESVNANALNVIPAIYTAPEANQIGNAYNKQDGGEVYVYTGEQTSITVDSESVNVYTWRLVDSDDEIYSTKPASEIYYIYDEPELGTYLASDTKFYWPNGEIVDECFGFYIHKILAPESEQEGNAYANPADGSVKDLIYNKEIDVLCTTDSKTIKLFLWTDSNEQWFSLPNMYALIHICFAEDCGVYLDGNTWTCDDYNSEELINAIQNNGDLFIASYPVLYQRTEEVYDWVNITSIKPALVEITYNDLKALRDASGLTPGMQYRITDYVTVVNDIYNEGIRVSNSQFDVIVTADSVNKLNENARAIRHVANNSIFSNNCLEAWELKYCLDNDTNRFAWADSTNGKGVIYYMKDEYNNECPYDFKNIRYKISGTTYAYTFSINTYQDATITKYNTARNNRITPVYKGEIDGTSKQRLNCIYISDSYGGNSITNNEFIESYGIKSNGSVVLASKFLRCNGFTINRQVRESVFEKNSNFTVNGSIIMSSFGFNCSNITINTSIERCSMLAGCYNITLGSGGTLDDTTLYDNYFEDRCHHITLGDACNYNHFGFACNNITLGNNNRNNIFETNCNNILIDNEWTSYITFEEHVSYCTISGYTTSQNSRLQNVVVTSGTSGTDSENMLLLSGLQVNSSYTEYCGLNSSGNYTVKNIFD